MKTDLIITLVLLLAMGCTGKGPAGMTHQQQETAKKEIGDVVNQISRNLEKMDIDALFQPYSNSSDFVFFTTNGSMEDLQQVKTEHAAWFKSLSALKVTKTKDKFTFLPGDDVICSWLGKFDVTLGAGQKLKIDKFGVTYLFRKIDNQWKVIYQHASALPPVPDMPAN